MTESQVGFGLALEVCVEKLVRDQHPSLQFSPFSYRAEPFRDILVATVEEAVADVEISKEEKGPETRSGAA